MDSKIKQKIVNLRVMQFSKTRDSRRGGFGKYIRGFSQNSLNIASCLHVLEIMCKVLDLWFRQNELWSFQTLLDLLLY